MPRATPLALALLVLLACGPYRGPRRPAGVPAEAVWVGNRQSGVFVEVGPKEGIWFRLRVFDDRTGALKADGVFIIQGMARVKIHPHEIRGWDGRAVILEDGTRLVPKP